MKKFRSLFLTGLIVAGILTNSGCNKDETSDAPTLPDISTMKMDTAFVSKLKSGSAVYEYVNFTKASVTVGLWSAAAYIYTAFPVLAFEKATSTKPVYDETAKVWIWTYNFNYLLTEYKAELTGKISETKVLWTMNISKASTPDQKFKWFEGESNFDNKSGSWQVYDPVKGASVRIVWSKESSTVGKIRYSNVIEGDINKNGYIEFGTTSLPMNKYFEISIVKDNITPANDGKIFRIEWSSSTKEGSIINVTNPTSPVKLGCWGSDYKDKLCN